MKRQGFTLDEIHNLTLPQIALYLKAGQKLDRFELVRLTNSMAMGSRGEEKALKQYIKSLEEA